MRNYQRLGWVPNQNTQEQVLLRLCADCGAVVGNEKAHDAWHGDDAEQVPRPASPNLPTPIELLLDGAQAITLWLNGTQPLDAAKDWWTAHAIHMRSLAAQLSRDTASLIGDSRP